MKHLYLTLDRQKELSYSCSSVLRTVLLGLLLLCIGTAMSQTQSSFTSRHFDMTRHQPIYSDSLGYGYDITTAPASPAKPAWRDGMKAVTPWFFSVKVPDGNYRVTVVLGSKRRKAETVVRAESRRLMVDACATRKGELRRFSFIVNKRSPYINDRLQVSLKPREHRYLDWDNRLTLEFNGFAPAVEEITIERADSVPTLYLCGNSTVVDQSYEPWTSWGQMVTRWFDDSVAVSNHAESGLTAGSFLAQHRLDKILTTLRPSDYVFCEFGHNDQKERMAGAGAWYNFAYNLKIFIDKVREKGATIVFVTPTQRRSFDSSHMHILETHGDYPAAMREVARRENVPVIELHDMTRTFFETLGFENSKRALVHYPAHTFANQDKPLADNTHFNPYGAYEIAKMVVMGMKQVCPSLVRHLRPEWTDFDPAHPDSFANFVWYPCPLQDIVKPDGN